MLFQQKKYYSKITSLISFYPFILQRLNIKYLNFQKTMFSIPPSNQVNKSSFHPFSQKLLPHTPSHKTNFQGHKAVKKLLNYSYGLNEEVGLGLTSKVFKGKNDLTGTPVAIKCIDVKKQNDTLSQEFLKEEINVLDRIKSIKANYLLKLQAVLLTANNLYIVTEFCDGKDVSKILRQRKQLSQQQAQTIMKQLIWGYRQLYSLGLIHRDLKLSNLLVSNGKIKLADFGFAINEDKCNSNFTYNVGSPKYMPPQTLKFNKYSFKSDLWAIGVMAYELVYGGAPWKSNVDAKLYEMIYTTPIQNLFDPNVSVSDHYKTFIVNCLRPNINERPGPDFLYNYSWPQSGDFVQGYQEQKKVPEVIKLPGKNYAVYTSSNQIQYEDKQLDLKDFVNNSSNPSQFILLSRLNYCKFLMDIFKNLSSLKQNNQLISALSQEIGMTIQIIMKVLGQTACMQFNRIQAPGFQSYIKTAEWKNLKQLIIRYDIQFRESLKSLPPLRKNATLPQSSALGQLISYLKNGLPENVRLIDKLITFLEIRQIFMNSKPLQFAQKVPMASIVGDYEIPDHKVNGQTLFNRVFQRLSMNGL